MANEHFIIETLKVTASFRHIVLKLCCFLMSIVRREKGMSKENVNAPFTFPPVFSNVEQRKCGVEDQNLRKPIFCFSK